MTSEYISEFVLSETGTARAAKGRIVFAVRTFIRFMICKGNAPAQLVHAIPRVRRWRFANLRKHLSAGELDAVMKACHRISMGVFATAPPLRFSRDSAYVPGNCVIFGQKTWTGPKGSCTSKRASPGTDAHSRYLPMRARCLRTTFALSGLSPTTVRYSLRRLG